MRIDTHPAVLRWIGLDYRVAADGIKLKIRASVQQQRCGLCGNRYPSVQDGQWCPWCGRDAIVASAA